MRSIFVFVVPFLIFASSVTGQVPLTEPCPEISVIGPPALMDAGESAVFSAIVDPKGLPVELTFTWYADGGRIEDGQGSTEIRVKRTEGKYLSVRIKADGMRPRCEKRFGATLYPETWSSEPKLIKAFSDWEEATRDGLFDEIYRQSQQFPLADFYVLACGSSDIVEWHKKFGDSLMDRLKETFGYHPPRFTIMKGTGDPHTIQVWITEVGDKAPDVERCSDTALRSSSDPTEFLAQEKKCAGVEYDDKNQVTPEALVVNKVAGQVTDEGGLLEGVCVVLFDETTKRATAWVEPDRKGRYRFKNVPPGKYRLVVKHEYDAYCIANIPIEMVKDRAKKGSIVVGMSPSGIDDCSSGHFET